MAREMIKEVMIQIFPDFFFSYFSFNIDGTTPSQKTLEPNFFCDQKIKSSFFHDGSHLLLFYKFLNLTNDTHNVTFFIDQIHTLVTRSPFLVDSWISEITTIHHPILHCLIIGLDIEWRPNNRFHDNPAATL
ncbi:hypothetical protein ACSBR1_009444 [Camellia fascicularis]